MAYPFAIVQQNNRLLAQINCFMCKKLHEIEISEDGLKRYQEGQHIQDCFPDMSPALREMFISGTCPKCFDEMFEGEEE